MDRKDVLIIVESPTKAKKISRFSGFTVRASMGHVRDLPPREPGVEIKDGKILVSFTIPDGKSRLIRDLRREAKGKVVILATDPDREGEAIAYHLSYLLKDSAREFRRMEMHEITKREFEKAVRNLRDINMDLVKAQMSRRVLDRVVGYTLSPLVSSWLKKRGLSAGRVQSTVLMEIARREREIRSFRPEKYWRVVFESEKDGIRFRMVTEKIKSREEAEKIAEDLESVAVRKVSKKNSSEKPPSPFTSSVLQQDAGRILGFSPEKTMYVAQKLFESGYITYHRTDSPRIADEVIPEIRRAVEKELGSIYLSREPLRYRAKDSAQDAHEGIRPADFNLTPEKAAGEMDKDMHRLYSLIWRRTLASQMAPFETVVTSVEAESKGVRFTSKGRVVVFEGWRKVYGGKIDDVVLPDLKEGEVLKGKAKVEEGETKPPARYTEGMIVRWMEKTGVGRPSTYASTIKVLKERGYIEVKKRKVYLTRLGEEVIKVLEKRFSEVCSREMTAEMEKKLDRIEKGEMKWEEPVFEMVEKFKKAGIRLFFRN